MPKFELTPVVELVYTFFVSFIARGVVNPESCRMHIKMSWSTQLKVLEKSTYRANRF